jgi:ribosomal protein L44E
MLTYGAVSQMQRTKSTELTEDQRQPDSENRFSGSENRFWFREPNAPNSPKTRGSLSPDPLVSG